MLHVTNGQSAADLLRAGGMHGDILPWDDALCEGPVPAGPSMDQLTPIRARYIASLGWGSEEEILNRFQQRNDTLEKGIADGEIALWFEHDLYDQLQLIQILDWLSDEYGDTLSIALIQTDTYLTDHTPEDVSGLYEKRVDLGRNELEHAQNVWKAFRAPEPTGLLSFPAMLNVTLRHVPAAILRHLQEFPSTTNGLTKSGQMILTALKHGANTPARLFRAAHCEAEEAMFMGDSMFAVVLAGLGQAEQPALQFSDGGAMEFHPLNSGMDDFWKRPVSLTPFGESVLNHEADWIEQNGIDRWLGGVHLSPNSTVWCWDESQRRLVTSR